MERPADDRAPGPGKVVKLVGYVRVDQAETGATGLTVGDVSGDLRQRARRYGIELIEVYADRDPDPGELHGLGRALDDLRAGRCEGLMMGDVSGPLPLLVRVEAAMRLIAAGYPADRCVLQPLEEKERTGNEYVPE